MKKLAIIAICIAAISFSQASFAQQKKDTSKVRRDIKKAADTVAQKTKEITAKGIAATVDKKYVDKVGPQGQTIYIDKHSRYYYINKKGNKIYVAKAHLKNKPENY